MTDRALAVMTGAALQKCLEIARLTRRRLGVVLPAKTHPAGSLLRLLATVKAQPCLA